MSKLYTLSDVAAAIGVPRPTLLSWTQRGYLRFLDDRKHGEVREFDRAEVAYAACFATIARSRSSASDASQIMEKAIGPQPKYWLKAITEAVRGQDVFVLAKAYDYNGAKQIEAELVVGTLSNGRINTFADGTTSGMQMAELNPDTSEAPMHDVAVYLVAPAIRQAIDRLA